ncbi:MAG: UvrD-helicase domain-containing protein [Moraxella sp.]|nr:UvrD-helicase domain-containing protein [Moraxella sp.]
MTDNMTDKTTDVQTPSELPAALACELSGAYLIEASAGTGKTWTLTGIILRLLIEKNYAPERIIATTFTKAAAKEMQERIHARLADFYDCCMWLQNINATHDMYRMNDTARMAILADEMARLPALGDLVNQHLLWFLLAAHPRQLGMTLRRTALLLTTLDKLFVGTLDSLAQKWLKEFKAEIGHNDNASIVTNPDEVVHAIIHDALRAEQARVYYDNPTLYALLDVKKFGDVQAMADSLNNALNFYSAIIDKREFDETAVARLSDAVPRIAGLDFAAILPYANESYRTEQGINKTRVVFKLMDELPNVLTLLQKNGLQGFAMLSDNQAKWLNSLSAETCEKAFAAKAAANLAIWQNLPNVDMLYRLGALYQDFVALEENYWVAFRAKLATYLRQELKARLESQNQTTFVLQTARLNEALSGRQGMNLARHIRHLYPVALIDEAQDVSGEQASLIERVYLQGSRDDDGRGRNFLLLVGDPKQAIYRFRGGDVANYNRMKAMQVNSSLSLNVNRRSNAALIDALNHWYGRGQHSSPANDLSNLGSGIDYAHITAHNETLGLDWYAKASANKASANSGTKDDGILPKKPLSVIHFHHHDDKFIKLAEHINSLLQGDTLLNRDGKAARLKPSDIAVLARTKADIYQMASELERYKIPVVLTRDDTVFDTQACADCYQLLLAVIRPSDERLGAMLTGTLMGYTWTDAEALLMSEDGRSRVVLYLKNLRQLWADNGIMRMLNAAFAKHPFTHDNLWHKIATSQDAERYLADMWQMFEVLAMQDLPMMSLMAWLAQAMTGHSGDGAYERIALPSEAGVSLMSIHKSKGLEFPVVYVLGLDGVFRSKDVGLYPYNDDKVRRLSASKGKSMNDAYFGELNDTEEWQERKRLAYVALTRASEQTFVVVKDSSRTAKNILQDYMDYDKGKFAKPARLDECMDWQVLSDELVQTAYAPTASEIMPIDYIDVQAVYARRDFVGVSKTSFSGLARSFRHDGGVLSVADYDEMAVDDMPKVPHSDDIRATFVRGVNAGSFLHKVLQYLDVHNPSSYTHTVDMQLRAFDLPKVYLSDGGGVFDNGNNGSNGSNDSAEHKSLVDWLHAIVHTPLVASGVSIAAIATPNKVSEMKFVLGLRTDFDPRQIHELFATHTDKSLPAFIDTNINIKDRLYQYLSGEIDLVYQHDGKYYVLDYKSNYLGDGVADHTQAAMTKEMDKHGYWLQALIYQVALHRMLKLRIADYVGNERRYLGAVEYYFVRGADGVGQAGLTWEIPLELVQAFDELLG